MEQGAGSQESEFGIQEVGDKEQLYDSSVGAAFSRDLEA